MQQGAPLSNSAGSFLNSSEFIGSFGAGLDDPAYVTQIYSNVLGRSPDPGGFAYWTSSLAAGISRAQTLAAISESAENITATASTVNAGVWVENETAASVARLYDTAFGRLPDLGGLSFWTKTINAGGATLDSAAAAFVGSAEFVKRYGSLENMGFIDALFMNTLHRAGDAAGRAYWISTREMLAQVS